MKKIIIVPAHNEEKIIARVLSAVREAAPDFDILVVNDGSTDRTSAIARSFPSVAIIDLPLNLGIGGTVQTGFIYAEKHGYELAVQVDADGQHRPSDIAWIVEPVLGGEADVVVGSRFMEKRGYRSTASRQLGIKLFSLTNRLLLRERISDCTSGFRAYSGKAIAILWPGMAIVFLAISLFRGLLDKFSRLVGVGYQPAALFLIMGLLVILIHFSVAISALQESNKRLAQEIGLLKNEREKR